ncbi:uncharacterized protein LOC129872797 [Solanum dulcamara]|uniref:uncharacterized protein LOC129872797 n=1 Tax=Solanum dulcamara TaxID=45834 RepID=UPI0024864B58|nr:uncharacterized protein LOC129872797 [Solanum dulcamara]
MAPFDRRFALFVASLSSSFLLTLLNSAIIARPTGSAPFPEVNVVAAHNQSESRQNNYRDHGRGHGRGRGRGCGRGRINYRHHVGNKHENNKGPKNNSSRGKSNFCHRCGMKGHWARECRTPEHFVKLYQASLKRRDNNVEANLSFRNNDDEATPSNKHENIEANMAYKDDDFADLSNITHLDAEDFMSID